jgi:5-formyltetrahydrofolate cyclo-ligase
MSDAKRVLRAQMRAERDDFASVCDAAIAPPAPFLKRLTPLPIVASYVATGSEADPSMLAAAARAAGCAIALPYVTGRESPIRFLAWDADVPLEDGPFGLKQPNGSGAEVVPDIILAPLLAFDDRLNRLGQGAGHYDRAFAAFPGAWRLGVGWSCQHLLSIETEPWDMPLHAVVTEKGMVS